MSKIKQEFDDAIKVSPINHIILYMIGVYLVVIFLLAIFVNALLLFVFARFKKLRTSLNKLIIVLTFFNLLGSVQFPFVIHSNFVHKLVYYFIKFFKNYKFNSNTLKKKDGFGNILAVYSVDLSYIL